MIFTELAVALTTANAQPFLDYGFEREFPACLDQMQETLTYPMAWGNSPIKSFDLWRVEARHCVLDAMQLAPPASTDYQMEVVARERREGYEARKLRFNLRLSHGQKHITWCLMARDHSPQSFFCMTTGDTI